MELDENIIFKNISSENYLPLINKTIEYYFIATEPEYNIYDTYPDEIEGESDENEFNNEEYIGKLSYYYITSNSEFSFECEDRNCILCKKELKSYCLTCISDEYSLSDNNGKTCSEKESEIITEIFTEPITEKLTLTEPITEKLTLTEPITEKLTELITEIKTEIITEIRTDKFIQPIKEEVTEKLTELKTEIETEIITEIRIDKFTQPIKEEVTEQITELMTKSITEQMTQPITEKITEYYEEPITEQERESITEKITEIITEKMTEKLEESRTEKYTQILTEKITEEIKKDDNGCTKQDILNNKCSDGSVTEEQVNQLYNQLKQDYLKGNFNGNNTVIQTQNVVFQISTLSDQKNSDNPNVSSIDLGECEKALKDEYGITEDLIVFKTDIKSEDLTQTYVQYEIYDPRDLKMLNLTICKDMKISVSTPVNLDSTTSSLYDLLKDSGYDLFNENDAFYTDVCSIFTSQNGTDMTLEDRKKEIFSVSGNLSLCQSGCELESYNSTTRKAKCNCSPQTEEVKISLSSSNDKFDVKKIGEGFMSTLKNSNFLVLKCYKLAIDLKTIWTNIGRILMTVIFIFSFIFLIFFCFSDRKKINDLIASIINNRINILNNNKKSKFENSSKFGRNNNKNKTKTNSKKKKRNSETKKKFLPKSKTVKLKQNMNSAPKKNIAHKNKKKSRTFKKKEIKINSKIISSNELLKNNLKRKILRNNSSNINYVKINNYNIKNFIQEKRNSKKKLLNKDNKFSIKEKNLRKTSNYYSSSKHNFVKKTFSNDNLEKYNNNPNYKNLNDEELNSLDYDIAILIDKRTYFQYYWSLLKKKQLILFTFIPSNDYNLFSIKICLFLLSFSLYFTINGFFFSD